MKQSLRNDMKKILAEMPADVAARKSLAACERLLGLEEYRHAGTLMAYIATTGELDAAGIAARAWEDGKIVAVPKVLRTRREMSGVLWALNDELVAGEYGIKEPARAELVAVETIDLIVVPALAFDRAGNRLGRGGGYYDRFLAQPLIRATTCGLAFADQLAECVPVTSKDYSVDMLVTDAEVLRF